MRQQVSSFQWTGVLLLALTISSACTPSQRYLQGHGFYSEQYTESDLSMAAKDGKLLERGHFSVDASECGVYTPGLAESRLVVPTLQNRMLFMGGNAVWHVKATEPPDIMLMSLFMIPMGCTDWTISGDVVYVDRPPALAGPRRE